MPELTPVLHLPANYETRFSSQQRTVLWVLWLTKYSLYFCRNNLGIAFPGLKEELHYDAKQMRLVLIFLELPDDVGRKFKQITNRAVSHSREMPAG